MIPYSFLSRFEEEALALYRENPHMGPLFSTYREKGRSAPIPFDYDELLTRLEAIRACLQVIYAILEKPVLRSISEETISRSERVGRLSVDSFQRTLRDPGLWRNKRGEIVPEYVHHEQYGDTIIRYENLFVILLLGYMERDLRRLENELTPVVPPFEAVTESRGLSFGKRSALDDYLDEELPYSAVFRQTRSDASGAYALARKIKKMIKNVRSTEFYRILSNEKPIDPDVISTNILLHDPRYNKLYRFYEEHYRLEHALEGNEMNTLYYNYVLFSLFAYFSKKKVLPKKESLSFEKGRFHFSPITYWRGPFEMTLREDPDSLALYLEARLNGYGDSPLSKARYRIDIVKDLDEEEDALLLGHLEEAGVEDRFIIAMNDVNHHYDRVLILNYYEGHYEERFERLFLATRMLFKCDSALFMERCPVCGDEESSFDGYQHACASCGARYRSFGRGRLAKLWITRFRKEGKGAPKRWKTKR